MFGRKKFGSFYDDDLFLGHLEEERKKEEKLSVDENSDSDEIKMEHAEKPQLIKEEGSAPLRRPWANQESMPKKKPPKKANEKK